MVANRWILRQPRNRAEPAPLIVVADREHEVAVRRREGFIGNDARVTVAEARGYFAAGEIIPGLVGQQRGDRVQHRQVDFLAATGTLAREQRHGHAIGREHAGGDIGDCHAETEAGTCRIARDAHQAALALHDGIVARLLRTRSGLAES